MSSPSDYGASLLERCRAAYDALVTALQQAWLDDDVRRPLEQAYAAYRQAAQVYWLYPPPADVPRRMAQQVGVPWQKATELFARRAEQAFHEYLDAIKDAWSAVPVGHLTPMELAGAAQSIALAAALQSSTMYAAIEAQQQARTMTGDVA